MMDCRQALQILEFDDRQPDGVPSEVCSADERALAEAHLETCPVCARTVQHRRELDRTIGDVMRAVPIPRGAQQRLLARLAELGTADAGTEAGQPAAVSSRATSDLGELHAAGDNAPRNGQLSSIRPAKPIGTPRVASRRKFLKRLVLVGTCVAVALVGFFGVVSFFMPRWSVDEISRDLAKLDFGDLNALSDFTGTGAAASLPSEPGWDRLQWKCGKKPKGLPLGRGMIAVYAFEIPKTHRSGEVRGLIAVIPRSQVRDRLSAYSVATAAPTGEYMEARIGESVCVAWQEQEGKVVYVCLIRGGADALSTLQGVLEPPSA
jgi:hypothetical protein